MAFKRPGSSVYQIRRKNLPGYGDTGQITSGVRDRRVAERMERLLEEVATRALSEPRLRLVLDAVCRGHSLSLADLMRAKAERRLDLLADTLSTVRLDVACAEAAEGADKPTLRGLEKIKQHFGETTAVRDMAESKRLLECFRAFEQSGIKRNSVRREVMRAASRLLTQVLGKAERDRVMGEIDFPATDDTREVSLTQQETTRLLGACRDVLPEFEVLVLTALLASADRGVLLSGMSSSGATRGLLVRDVAVYTEAGEQGGEIYSAEISMRHDSKSEKRARTVTVADRLARELYSLCHGRGENEPVFSIRYEALDHLWKRARVASGLPHLRFKDLRAQFAIAADRAGIPTAVASSAMGHSHERMTARYQRHKSALSCDQASSLERTLLGEEGASARSGLQSGLHQRENRPPENRKAVFSSPGRI